MGKKKYQFDVFLSDAHVDAEWVDKLKSALEDRGVTVWRDKENIRPGDMKKWAKDFDQRKEEWVKTLRQDVVLGESVMIANDIVKSLKAKNTASK